jgi:hypothetical protein
MKRLALSILLFAGCSNQTVKKVEALAKKACACADAACAEGVEKEYYALVKESGQTRGSEDDRDEVEAAYGTMRDCIAKARGAAPVETPK